MARRLQLSPPTVRTWADLEAFGISYVAPKMMEEANLPRESFDMFYSVDTLEHIPPDDLALTLSTARRLLRPDGVSVHIVDYSDHYARGSDVSRFNFLTFDDAAWEPFNTRMHYVNRLRHSQMLTLFETARWVVRAEPESVEPQPEIVARLAMRFGGMKLEDLFTIRALLVARLQ
jgi:SAM-dependent methyltransferase